MSRALKFFVKVRTHTGGRSYTPWTVLGQHSSIEEAQAGLEAATQQDFNGVAQISIFHNGKIVAWVQGQYQKTAYLSIMDKSKAKPLASAPALPDNSGEYGVFQITDAAGTCVGLCVAREIDTASRMLATDYALFDEKASYDFTQTATVVGQRNRWLSLTPPPDQLEEFIKNSAPKAAPVETPAATETAQEEVAA